jgi:hypothetical protein
MLDMPFGRDIAGAFPAGRSAERSAARVLKTMRAMMITIPMPGTGLTRAP